MATVTRCASPALSPVATTTLGDGAGDVLSIFGLVGGNNTAKLGNGHGDVVNTGSSGGNTITVGNGNGDVVNDFHGRGSTITVGNGNDTIYVGNNDTVTVGTGQDSFIFQQTTPGNIGAVTVTGFDPSKHSFTFSNQLTTSVSYQDNAQGNAVITVDSNPADTITLVGVHASDLHPSDFHFADPAVAADAHLAATAAAHAFLL
jgi:hypothetical protein